MRWKLVLAGLLGLTLWMPNQTFALSESMIEDRQVLSDGLSVFKLKVGSPNVVNVVSINPGSKTAIQLVTPKPGTPHGRATTSELCKQTPDCVVAVNAGFFHLSNGQPREGQELDKLTKLLEPVVSLIPGKLQALFSPKQKVHLGNDSHSLGNHPRTVMFGNAEGHKWFATVDGRQPGYSKGMPLGQATELAKQFGATWAVNLDGGCSTTLVVKGKVKNRPCKDGQTKPGTSERPVGSAYVVTAKPPKPKPPVAVAAKPTLPPKVEVLGKTEVALSSAQAQVIPAPESQPNKPLRGLALTLLMIAAVLARSQSLRLRGKSKDRLGIKLSRSSICVYFVLLDWPPRLPICDMCSRLRLTAVPPFLPISAKNAGPCFWAVA